jgi:hypothetical protein
MLFPLPEIVSLDIALRRADGKLHGVSLRAPQYCERYIATFADVAARLGLPKATAAVAAP